MGQETSIEWCDATLNLWEGCNKVAATCKNCYAARQSHWLRPEEKLWGLPEHGAYRREVAGWRKTLSEISKRANKEQRPLRVFVGSMMDIWEDGYTPTDKGRTIGEVREEFFAELWRYPHLIFLLLTSRPQNIVPILNGRKLPPNVWLGASVGNQEEYREMALHLTHVTGEHWSDWRPKRFLSIEPMLGPISMIAEWRSNGRIDFTDIRWIIVGGESGPNARKMEAQWVRDLIIGDCGERVWERGQDHRQKKNEGGRKPPVFFKQWGEYGENGERVGKKKAGNLLDGKQYLNLPAEMKIRLSHNEFMHTVWGMDYSLVYAEPWFTMCADGTKGEEYRNPASKSYKALRQLVGKKLHGCRITGYHGYAADRRQFTRELLQVTLGEGKTEWGAEQGVQYLVLHLGREVGKFNRFA